MLQSAAQKSGPLIDEKPIAAPELTGPIVSTRPSPQNLFPHPAVLHVHLGISRRVFSTVGLLDHSMRGASDHIAGPVCAFAGSMPRFGQGALCAFPPLAPNPSVQLGEALRRQVSDLSADLAKGSRPPFSTAIIATLGCRRIPC